MASAVGLWSDYRGADVRALARLSRDGNQVRRRLALAVIYEGMTLHLAEISAAVAPGAHAVRLLDQAGWPLSSELVVPANITLLPLPAKCPELNPVENVWQFMRGNGLSNRSFKSYEDILNHCCFA
jgi:hypothetical protein